MPASIANVIFVFSRIKKANADKAMYYVFYGTGCEVRGAGSAEEHCYAVLSRSALAERGCSSRIT
jgi:hypothetical protein